MKKYTMLEKTLITALVIIDIMALSCLCICMADEYLAEDQYIIRYRYIDADYEYTVNQVSMFGYVIVFDADDKGTLFIDHDNGLQDKYDYDIGHNEIFHIKCTKIQYTYVFQDKEYYKWYYKA